MTLNSGPAAHQDGETAGKGLVELHQRLRQMVLDTLGSLNCRRNDGKALDDLYAFSAGRPLTRAFLVKYRASLEVLSASTINLRLSAIRKMVSEARLNGMVGSDEAASLSEIPNIRQKGTPLGNWLAREQARELLAVPERSTVKAKRDFAILVECALRRQELASLDVETIQLQEGRWILADLEGKGREGKGREGKTSSNCGGSDRSSTGSMPG